MKYHWIRDRIRAGHFSVRWRKGSDNLADFLTKPLPVKKHQELMKLLIHVPLSVLPPAPTSLTHHT